MKTVAQLRAEQQNILLAGKKFERWEKEYGQLEDKYAYLQTCIFYLQSNPSEDFLNKEKQRIENILSLIEDGFKKWEEQETDKDKATRGRYNRLMSRTAYVRQLEFINFILS